MNAGIVFDILLLDNELEKENGLEIAREYPYKKETRKDTEMGDLSRMCW